MPTVSYLRGDPRLPPQQELRPDFYMDSVRDDAASNAAGREIYREVERVRLIIPGITATVVVHNVNQGHIQRWPQYYEAFKRGLEAPISGTPLEQWPYLNASQVRNLRAHEVRTVEEIAALSDQACSQLGPGAMEMRTRARAFLNDAVYEAFLNQVNAERDQLKVEVVTLQHQVDELSRQLMILGEQNRQVLAEMARHTTLARTPGGLYPPGPAPQPHYQPEPPAPIENGGFENFAQNQVQVRERPQLEHLIHGGIAGGPPANLEAAAAAAVLRPEPEPPPAPRPPPPWDGSAPSPTLAETEAWRPELTAEVAHQVRQAGM